MRLHEIEQYSVYNDPLYLKYKKQIDFAINKYIKTGVGIFKGSPKYPKNQLIFRDPNSFPEPRTKNQSQCKKLLYIMD